MSQAQSRLIRSGKRDFPTTSNAPSMASTVLVGHGLRRIEEMAYYAGIIDGEGCISYYKSLGVSVEGLYPKTLIEMHTVFGGSVSEIKRANKRRYYRWRIYGKGRLPDALRCFFLIFGKRRSKQNLAWKRFVTLNTATNENNSADFGNSKR